MHPEHSFVFGVFLIKNNFSHIKKTIFDGDDKIYTQEFTLDDEVLKALVDIKNGKLI